ncbi:MAG TPA: hypothetical protein EYP87_06775, partial [Flavobacteriaceae bacterium]|nr:hypothetical protein [Flavobacteriaceae bacterium]
MSKKKQIPSIIEIPQTELKELDKLIKSYRKKYIRNSQEIVDKVFKESPSILPKIKDGNVSKPIAELREIVWNEYLIDEVEFNVILMQDLYNVLDTPKHILDLLLTNKITELKGAELNVFLSPTVAITSSARVLITSTRGISKALEEMSIEVTKGEHQYIANMPIELT